jgi:hypothetical protein
MADFINTRNLPSKGKPGDIYRDAASTRIYIALGDGSLCDLGDLLSEARPAVRLVGPPGERGAIGAQGDFLDSAGLSARITSLENLYADLIARVERGDEMIRGPKGDSVKGDTGPAGDILYVGPAEMEAAARAARHALIDQRAKFMAALAQAMQETGSIHHDVYRRRCQQFIEQVKREAGL